MFVYCTIFSQCEKINTLFGMKKSSGTSQTLIKHFPLNILNFFLQRFVLFSNHFA